MNSSIRNTLFLHLHEGSVWYSTGNSEPYDTRQSPSGFFQGSVWKDAAGRDVRLAGYRSNAELITNLYDLRRDGAIDSVRVVSPRILAGVARKYPPVVLEALHSEVHAKLPSTLGGYHEIGLSDYVGYKLASQMRSLAKVSKLEISSTTLELLETHPVMSALKFTYGLHLPAVAHLIGWIVDPRWFVDLRNPNSPQKLQRALGLDLDDCCSAKQQRKLIRRRELVHMCWMRTGFYTTPSECNENNPNSGRQFLWRYWKRLAKLYPEHECYLADIHTSRKFVSFLQEVWLDRLYDGSKAVPDYSAPVFRPTDFFDELLELTAFQQWKMQKIWTDK